MPRSSRHKSHKQSKHSSRDYSDSDEDVTKMKEKSSKEDNSVRGHRDSASGEKRKISSHLREGKDSKDLSSQGNGDVVEEYVSSKRRKEKTDAAVGGDRWNGGGDDRVDGDRNLEKEVQKAEILKVESKVKESSSKGENLKLESKSKSKRHESGVVGERKEDSLTPVVLDREEGKSKSESKRKSERDSSSRKEGKESKDKDRRLEKEKNGGQESKSVDADSKFVEMDAGKKQVALGVISEERQGKRSRENTERTLLDESRNPEPDKEIEKKIRRKREGSSEREKYYDDYKEGDERRLSSKSDRAKDVKYRDDKYKDGAYADKYLEDGHKDDKRRDDKYREESEKDHKHQDTKYGEDGEKDARRRDDRHREDGDRDSRRKDEKHREDGERDSRRKDERNREGNEREGRRDDKYYEDGDRDSRRKDDRYHEDGDKDFRRGDERYHDDGDRDDRQRDNSYRDDGDREYRHKEDKYRDDSERDTRHKDSKQADGFDRDKRARDSKYRDERPSRDRTGDKSDLKRSRDDGYSGDHYARKSSAYDDSPTRDDRAARYRDDQSRRRHNEKEDYGDAKSRALKDQRSDAEKKSASNARIDPSADRGRSTSRNADGELTSSHGRRRSSPTANSHASRDHHRALKQDESKYRDYNYEERVRSSTRDYVGTGGGSEKASSSRSIEKLGQKDDGHYGELSADRRLKSDIRSSPLHLVDKSPSSSTDRRQFNRSDVRRGIDFEESTPRSGGSRDWKDYTGKEARGSRELGMDVLPGEELLPADADTTSVSSPFARNNHFSSNSKSLPPPPPFRTGIDSSPLISGEDDGRGKSNIRHRRIGDSNMGRIQGNHWRGVPSWPSPVANGFMHFPHGPPPVAFHSVMQPFPAPPMFGVRPSVELNHPGAYHMQDADRFSGPVRPMAWRNQVGDSCPPMHAWDAGNAAFGDESHIYGRPDWDHSRNLPVSRGWESSGDPWKGQSRSECVEMPSSEKENNNFIRSGDDALAGQYIQPAKNDQIQADQFANGTDICQPTKIFEKDDDKAPLVSAEVTEDVSKISRKDDVNLFHVYLSKLDISADLTEPEIFTKCTGLINMDQCMSSDIDDAKILYIEDIEANIVSHGLLNSALFGSYDDSVFQKSMSLYKMRKDCLLLEHGDKLKVSCELIPNSDQENEKVEDGKTDLPCPVEDVMVGLEGSLPDVGVEVEHKNATQEAEGMIVSPVATTLEKSEDPVSPLEHRNREVDSEVELGPAENDVVGMVERVEGSNAPTESISNEKVKLVDSKCDPLVNSDMFSEASEAIVPGSVNLSRIHHSPESTH